MHRRMSEFVKAYGVLERVMTELCVSKTKHTDEHTLESVEIQEPQDHCKLLLLKRHCWMKQADANIPLTELLLRDNAELATIIVMQFYPREEWELLLRNRLEKLKRQDLLCFLPCHDKKDEAEGRQVEEDSDMSSMQEQMRIIKMFDSNDPNSHIYALQELNNAFEKDVEIVRDIAKKHLGQLLVASEDPQVLYLTLKLIASLGVNGKNARAVVTKLESFCEAWPLKGRKLVDFLSDSITDEKEFGEDLVERVRGLKIERVPANVPCIEDMLPSYFTADHIEDKISSEQKIEEDLIL